MRCSTRCVRSGGITSTCRRHRRAFGNACGASDKAIVGYCKAEDREIALGAHPRPASLLHRFGHVAGSQVIEAPRKLARNHLLSTEPTPAIGGSSYGWREAPPCERRIHFPHQRNPARGQRSRHSATSKLGGAKAVTGGADARRRPSTSTVCTLVDCARFEVPLSRVTRLGLPCLSGVPGTPGSMGSYQAPVA